MFTPKQIIVALCSAVLVQSIPMPLMGSFLARDSGYSAEAPLLEISYGSGHNLNILDTPIIIPRTVGSVSPHAIFHPRTVYNPHITSPHDGTVWHVGTAVTVTWDTSNIPSDAKGKILLGHADEQSQSEHLDTQQPLAENIDLRAGHVKVTVPNVEKRKDYIVILMGDSGNASSKFTIS